MNNFYTTNFDREEFDFYETPEWCTDALLPHLRQHLPETSLIIEPACGLGKISNILRLYYPAVMSHDIHNRGYAHQSATQDFLTATYKTNIDAVITNPPYGKLAQQFTERALQLTQHSNGIVALFLRLEYDCAKSRIHLFNAPPFAHKIILTKRPRWKEYSEGDKSPIHNYAWFIWNWKHQGPPTISYHSFDKKRFPAVK